MALSRYCRLTWSCSLVNSDCFLTHLLGSVTRDSSTGETKLFRKGPARNSVLCDAPVDKRLTFKCKVNVIRKKPTEDSRILNLITITWSRISQWQSEYCLENCQPFDYKFCFIGKIIRESTIAENICSICQLCLDFFSRHSWYSSLTDFINQHILKFLKPFLPHFRRMLHVMWYKVVGAKSTNPDRFISRCHFVEEERNVLLQVRREMSEEFKDSRKKLEDSLRELEIIKRKALRLEDENKHLVSFITSLIAWRKSFFYHHVFCHWKWLLAYWIITFVGPNLLPKHAHYVIMTQVRSIFIIGTNDMALIARRHRWPSAERLLFADLLCHIFWIKTWT